LKALTQTDEHLLFGRDDVIRETVANCRYERLTILNSEPGLGITTLLQAGIAPALRRAGYTVVIFNDWQGRFFVTSLREAVANAVRETDEQFYAEGEPLEQLIARAYRRSGVRVALLLDQFEDYIRCHSGTEISDNFDAELAHAVAARQGAFVIGMQDHAIPAFERLDQHIANLRGFEITLKPISADAARQAVTADAAERELKVEEGVLEGLLSSTVVRHDSGGIHPFYLKLASDAIFDVESRGESSIARTATVETLGGVDNIILEYLDKPLSEFGTTQTELIFRWCKILISPERRRLSVTEKGLTAYAGKLNRFASPMLQRLTELGIYRVIDMNGTLRYEIARDCLTPILRDWWERREAVLVARRRFQFRILSLSIALGAILAVYILWRIIA
jgi:hypothetical protein